jgi:hypothetical protein
MLIDSFFRALREYEYGYFEVVSDKLELMCARLGNEQLMHAGNPRKQAQWAGTKNQRLGHVSRGWKQPFIRTKIGARCQHVKCTPCRDF